MLLNSARCVMIASALSTLAACSDGTAPKPRPVIPDKVVRVRDCDGPPTSVDPALLPVASGPHPPDINEIWASVARENPGGFAAVYRDTSAAHTPTILMTDPTQASTLEPVLDSVLAKLPLPFDVKGATVLQARWDAAQLIDWYTYIESQPVWAGANVSSTGIDQIANRIRINVVDTTSQSAFVRRLDTLDLPCDLVNVGIMPYAQLD